MSQETYLIEIDNESPDRAAAYLDELREAILDQTPDITVEKYRDASNKQDFFSGLSTVLGTKALTELAKGISDWLKLRRSASITIKTPEGEIVAKNLTSTQAADLADKLLETMARKNS